MRPWLISLATAALLLAPAAALAQPSEAEVAPQDPRVLFMHGQRAYEQGDYETALSDWNRAYELDARPRIQFNLSQAYERLGRMVDAAAALDRYLETADADDEHQADARARRSAIRERLGRTGVQITGAPDGATILIDDRDWGRTPRPDAIRLEPGSHQVIIRLDGYRDFRSSVHVAAGQTIEVTAEMEVDENANTGGDTSESPWPWVLIGGGGAMTLIGLAVGTAAMDRADQSYTGSDDAAGDAEKIAGTADILLVLGIITAGIGVTWWLTGRPDAVDEQVGVTAVVHPGAVGVQAQGRF